MQSRSMVCIGELTNQELGSIPRSICGGDRGCGVTPGEAEYSLTKNSV